MTAEGNFWIAPRPSKMHDLQVMVLAISADPASGDSQDPLFSKVDTDYKKHFLF